jgi:hypothetical protein
MGGRLYPPASNKGEGLDPLPLEPGGLGTPLMPRIKRTPSSAIR